MEKEDKNIKLSKCPHCGRAFYIKTAKKGDIEIICPFCEQKVTIKINDDEKHENGTS